MGKDTTPESTSLGNQDTDAEATSEWELRGWNEHPIKHLFRDPNTVHEAFSQILGIWINKIRELNHVKEELDLEFSGKDIISAQLPGSRNSLGRVVCLQDPPCVAINLTLPAEGEHGGDLELATIWDFKVACLHLFQAGYQVELMGRHSRQLFTHGGKGNRAFGYFDFARRSSATNTTGTARSKGSPFLFVMKIGQYKPSDRAVGTPVEKGTFHKWIEHFSRPSRLHETMKLQIKRPVLANNGIQARFPSSRTTEPPKAPARLSLRQRTDHTGYNPTQYHNVQGYNYQGSNVWRPGNSQTCNQHSNDSVRGHNTHDNAMGQMSHSFNDPVARSYPYNNTNISFHNRGFHENGFNYPDAETRAPFSQDPSFPNPRRDVVQDNRGNTSKQRSTRDDRTKQVDSRGRKRKTSEREAEALDQGTRKRDGILKQLEVKTAELSQALAKVADLHTKLEAAGSAQQSIEADLEHLRTENSSLTRRIAEYESGSLRRRLDEASEKLRVQELQLPNARRETESIRLQLEKRLQDAKKEIEGLGKRLHGLEAQSSRLSESNNALNTTLAATNQKLSERSNSCNESTAIIIKEQRRAKDADTLVTQLRDELKRTQAQLACKEKVSKSGNAEMQKQTRWQKGGPRTTPDNEAMSRTQISTDQVWQKEEQLQAALQRASTAEMYRDGRLGELTMLKARVEELKVSESKSRKEAKRYKDDLVAKKEQLNHALLLVASFNKDDVNMDENKRDRDVDSDEDDEQVAKRIKQEGYSDVVTLD